MIRIAIASMFIPLLMATSSCLSHKEVQRQETATTAAAWQYDMVGEYIAETLARINSERNIEIADVVIEFQPTDSTYPAPRKLTIGKVRIDESVTETTQSVGAAKTTATETAIIDSTVTVNEHTHQENRTLSPPEWIHGVAVLLLAGVIIAFAYIKFRNK